MQRSRDNSVQPSRKTALDAMFLANRATATAPWSWYGLEQLTGVKREVLIMISRGKPWAACERLLDAVLAGAPPARIRRLGAGLRAAVSRRRNRRRSVKRGRRVRRAA